MRPLLQELAPRKESLTMENVFAPQAQQLQTAISPELSIAATSYDLLLRLRPFRAQSVPNSRLAALGMDKQRDRERERETERQTDRVTFSLTMSKAPRPSAAGQILF